MRLLTLLLICTSAPLHAQVQFSGMIDGGLVIPTGDLGSVSAPGPYVAIGARAGLFHSRVTFGLELNFTRAQFDSLQQWQESSSSWVTIAGPTWKSYGVMARLEYRIIDELYSIGGAGILQRERGFDEAPSIAEPLETTDPAYQIGLGYRLGPWLATELRLVNVFTVDDSERWLLLTAGARF